MITEFNRDNPVKNLPDAYSKSADSNNAKILQIEKTAQDGLLESIAVVSDSLDIDKATGHTLDLYGEMIGQNRGRATDEQYRVLLKAQIVRNLTNTDFNGVINAICATFGCAPSDILLVEVDGTTAVRIDQLPISALNNSNIEFETAVQIIEKLMPVGVTLESLNFSGTFEFGSTEMEYDEAKGFADVAQTIGGSLGMLPTANKNPLPV